MTQLYTNSRLKVLRDCLRKHFYQYVLNIRTPSSYAADFGTVGHEALEMYLRAWMEGRPEARLSAAIATINTSKFDDVTKAKLRVLISSYHLRWGSQPWDVLDVEKEFRYELPDDHDELDGDAPLVGGKMDALIRNNEDGRVYVLEHKFTGSDVTPGSAYWEKLAIDTQVSIYIDGATVLGHEIAGCIYDVIKRPEHELLAATPEDKRKYTQGKGCKLCGGNLQGKQGTGKTTATQSGDCAQCKGHGWRLDDEGKPESPRLYATQRDTDETIEEFEDRLVATIGERVDDFLIRNLIVRLEDNLPHMRKALRDTIKLEQVTSAARLRVPNSDACSRYGSLCHFFAACSGRADITDSVIYPRAERAHPELASAA